MPATAPSCTHREQAAFPGNSAWCLLSISYDCYCKTQAELCLLSILFFFFFLIFKNVVENLSTKRKEGLRYGAVLRI